MINRLHVVFDGSRLDPAWALEWSREMLEGLASDPAVRTGSVYRLTPASDHYLAGGDWLLDVELMPGADPGAVVDSAPCACLLHDLEELRLRPQVHVLRVP